MKTALVYSTHSEHTSAIAKLIKEHLKSKVTEINLEDAPFDELLKYDLLILGVSTWFDGELPNYWDEYLPGIDDQDFTGKKIAIFGLGNQIKYPENYQDGMGILAEFFKKRGGEIIGYTDAKEYKFESSEAYENGQFCGLAIDNSFPKAKITSLVSDWTKHIS